MARKSRVSGGTSEVRSSSKRPTPPESDLAVLPKRPRRQASAANLNTSPTKSKYFEGGSDSDEETSQTSADGGESAFEDDIEQAEATSDQDEDDSSVSDEDQTPRRGSTSKLPKASGNSNKNQSSAPKHVWKEGVKTGLGPGTQVIIKKPKARPAGSTPYEDHTIHPNTLLFLRDLKTNNNRPWLKAHDLDFRQSEQDWKSYVEALTEKIAELDETIPELPYKDVVFRIYRDVRFSKDPTPYKAHFSAAWSRTGRKGPYAAYYVQIQPNGQSLVAGGLWMPEAPALSKLRRAVDRHPRRLKQVLTEAGLRKEYLKGVANSEAKAVKVFCDHNAGSALKTKPKGYDPDHADIDLLRLKSFTLSRRLSDEEINHTNSLETVSRLISHLVPFVTYLNSVVMPDEDDSQDSSDEQESGIDDEEEA